MDNPLLSHPSWKNKLKSVSSILFKPMKSSTTTTTDSSVRVLQSLLTTRPQQSTNTTHPDNLRLGTLNEIQILAMLMSAQQADMEKYKHIVMPTRFLNTDTNENVIQFEPLMELQLSDLGLLESAELTNQLMLGLNAIHALKICHFQIIPNHLMINLLGNLVITEFALARVCDGSVHPPGRGTRGYIAPELYPPRQCYTTSADMYSAGIVIGQMVEPYLSHLNLRILGGSNSFPVHIEQVWSDLREFVEIDALSNDDIFPPILQLLGDFLLRLLTSATTATPTSSHRYVRLNASQALNHPYLSILRNKDLALKEFKFLTLPEWRLRRAGDQLRQRHRRLGFDMFRLAG